MRSILPFLLLAFLSSVAAAQGAHWQGPEYAGTFTDPELDEVSGLAASRAHPGFYWAHNDSGSGAKLMLIKPDGTRVASLGVEGVTNVDWEDLDSFDLDGKHYLLVADTGDNGGIRKELALTVFEEPAEIKDGGNLHPAWTIRFRWPDGARDCEATAVDASKREVLLISKKRVPPELFRLPLIPKNGFKGVQTAEFVAHLNGIAQPSEEDLKQNPVYGRYRSQITGADLSPNGRVLAVLNYHSVFLYVRRPKKDWSHALHPSSALRFPWLPQAEAIAFANDGGSLLIGSEQRLSPLLRFQVKQ